MTMTKTLDERLERIDELRTKRDEKRAELQEIEEALERELSGNSPKPLTVRDRQQEKPNGGKGRPAADRKKTKERAESRFATKPCCGSKGARHMKGCAGVAPETRSYAREKVEQSEPATAARPGSRILTTDEFTEVKKAQESKSENSVQLARRIGIPLKEIHLAFFSGDYATYISKKR